MGGSYHPEVEPTEPSKSWRFAVVLPVAFVVLGALGAANPGDEYGLFALATLPVIWLPLLLAEAPDTAIALTLLAGAALAFGAGLALDRLRASPRAFAVVAAALFALALWLLVRPFATVEAAVAKNGSLVAYVACAAQLALQGATVLLLGATAVRRFVQFLLDDDSRLPAAAARQRAS